MLTTTICWINHRRGGTGGVVRAPPGSEREEDMALYLVRIEDTKIAVGLISADNMRDLFCCIDEITDPYVCEIRKIPRGGGIRFTDVVVPVLDNTLLSVGNDNDGYNYGALLISPSFAFSESVIDAVIDDDSRGWRRIDWPEKWWEAASWEGRVPTKEAEVPA